MKKLKRLKKIELIEYINQQEDKIQDMNIRLKYALFDSEACQRENEYLRKMLEDKE